MSSTAPEYLWIVEESAFTTPVVSPVVGTSQFLVPLIDSNSFTGVEDPVFSEIAYGGGLDVVADVVADTREVKISLSTLGYPALTAFLMGAAITRINAGQTLPWVTTEPAFDQPSFSIYHMIRGRDGVWIPWAYPGCKIGKIDGSVSRSDPKLKLKLDIIGTKEFPNAFDSSAAITPPAAPTEAQYPKGPYLFSHTGGNVKLAGSALTMYDELNFSVTNKLDPRAFESHWVQVNQSCGREASSDVNLLLRSTSDLRATYQALTSEGYNLEFNNGTHSATLNFNGNNHINKLPYDLPLGKLFAQKATFRNKWDASANSGAGGDLTFSST